MEIRAATADWHILRLSEFICIYSPGFFCFFFVCIKCAHELPLRAPTGLSASLSSPCSCKPVTRDLQLVPTQSRTSVSDWQRRLSHFFSLQQRLCNKPKSIFLNLFPPCVVILGCVTRVCLTTWISSSPFLKLRFENGQIIVFIYFPNYNDSEYISHNAARIDLESAPPFSEEACQLHVSLLRVCGWNNYCENLWNLQMWRGGNW